MILFRIEHDQTLEDVIETFREVLGDLGFDLDLLDEDDAGWLEFGIRRSRDEVS